MSGVAFALGVVVGALLTWVLSRRVCVVLGCERSALWNSQLCRRHGRELREGITNARR